VTLSTPTPFLEGIAKKQLPEILGAAKIRKISARHVILREGNPAAQLFLLKSGLVKFYRLTPNGDEVLLAQLRPGDTFGLGTLLARPASYLGTAETTRDSEIVVWEQARIQSLARKYPRLSQNAFGIVLHYLTAHFDRLFDLVSGTAADRLARVLIRLSKRAGKVSATGIEMDALNEDLGALANVSAFTVSRLLNKWARKGALAKSRGKIFIRAPEKLVTN
jgi:CRP-like cAMP-binding protein